MKAVVYRKYGRAADVLAVEEVDRPKPEPGEVLVEVRATGLNSWDMDNVRGIPLARVAWGWFKPSKGVLGCDIAGVVVELGEGANDFAIGDAVYGDVSAASWGGFAEFARAPQHLLARKPESMSFEQAAALPQGGVLALQGLRHRPLAEGTRLLINGAGGAVGTIAIQLARAGGAHITGVDTASKAALMTELGADVVIDYQSEDVTGTGQTWDLILDNIGTRSMFAWKRSIAPGGKYLMVGGHLRRIFQMLLFALFLRVFSKKRMGILAHRTNREDLEELNRLFEAKTIEPVIDSCYPLEETAVAVQRLQDGEIDGKAVIVVSA